MTNKAIEKLQKQLTQSLDERKRLEEEAKRFAKELNKERQKERRKQYYLRGEVLSDCLDDNADLLTRDDVRQLLQYIFYSKVIVDLLTQVKARRSEGDDEGIASLIRSHMAALQAKGGSVEVPPSVK